MTGENALTGLVDLHCHLDLYPDHARAVDAAEKAGVFTLAVTTTPLAWRQNQALSRPTKYVRAALGLHPQLVAERSGELSLWKELLLETRYVGEVGLDAGSRFYRSFEQQKQVFEEILRCCAKAGNKVITVHSVRAVKTVLDYVEAFLPPTSGRVVLHWFTGSKSEARRAVDMGCYFSVNQAMLLNERHRTMVLALPENRILTETDGPFTKTDNRPSEPADVLAVVNMLAELKAKSPQSIAVLVRSNLRELLST
ncbi:TatD family hydrolase [Steroidobacter agaridevorans]|uniref:TatD family hydrolase n=1 Tax=Steroidobacter agaridevorans TaxID=2695856 RepID=A0A829YN45_9GAMM|nr:Qat anti-phage system TatD family nuclease QatD [Steroidobacter agaridevorans]GFE84670.1 TatD family hydrolase [Steroidobacter agaridevorans]